VKVGAGKVSYKAAILVLLHLLSFRGEVYSFVETDSPDSAIFIKATALSRSTNMYIIFVNIGHVE
jgi:hypothetical protein